MPKEVRAVFAERIKRTGTVESFRFMPSEKMEFAAGQFLEVIFDEVNRKNRNLNKYLSFSSSPTKDYVEVTKRLSESAFSGKLKGLEPGDIVLLRSPLGNCAFDPGSKKTAFLIGGIGITPVISIIEYIVEKKLDTSLVLFYSNRTPEEIAFKDELDTWRAAACNVKVIYTVTDCPPKEKSCEFGFIDKNAVAVNIPDVKERMMFIFGPPGMVDAMKKVCAELGLSPEKVKTESFAGY
jgi:ferredoxin-NADP reductase